MPSATTPQAAAGVWLSGMCVPSRISVSVTRGTGPPGVGPDASSFEFEQPATTRPAAIRERISATNVQRFIMCLLALGRLSMKAIYSRAGRWSTGAKGHGRSSDGRHGGGVGAMPDGSATSARAVLFILSCKQYGAGVSLL